jgi:hypothetical protein
MGLATVGTARSRIVNDQASVPIHLAFYCILREGGRLRLLRSETAFRTDGLRPVHIGA